MKYDDLVKRMEGARKRLDILEQQAGQSSAHPGLLSQTLAELGSSFEELRVANEELRRQHEALLASRQTAETEHQRYHELFEFATVSYLVTDPDGNISEANRAAAVLLNIPQRLLLGMPFPAFVTEKDRPALYEHLSHVRCGPGPPHRWEWEVEMQPHTTRPFPAALTVGWVQSPEGHLLGLRWLLREMTEANRTERKLGRVQAELQVRTQERRREQKWMDTARQESAERNSLAEALRASEERYRSLVEMSPEAIGVHRDGKWVYLNPAAVRLFGAAFPADLFDESVMARIHLDDRAAWSARTGRAEGAQVPLPIHECRMLRLDRHLIDTEVTETSVLFQGAPASLLIIKDITARKRADEDREHLLRELEGEKARWQATVEGMLDAVITCDSAGRITYMNAACSRMLAHEPSRGAEILGIPAKDSPPFLRDPECPPLHHAARTGENVRNVEVIRRMSNGSTRTLVWSAAPLRDDNGRGWGAVAVGRDITEQRTAELSIRAAHEVLKRQLDEKATEEAGVEWKPPLPTREPANTEEEIRHLTQEMERRVKALAALDHAGRALAGSLNVADVLRILMEEMRALLNVDGATVLRCSPDTETLIVIAADGAGAKHLVGRHVPVKEGLLASVLRGRRPTRLEETSAERPHPQILEELAGTPLRSLLAVPLMAQGKVEGVLVGINKPGMGFTEEDERILASLASMAALAIENASLYGTERRRRQQVEAMRAIAGEITRELDLSKVLGLIADHAGGLLGTRSATVWLWDEDLQALVAHVWPGRQEGAKSPRLRLGEDLAGLVAERREGQIINDYHRWPQARSFLSTRGTTTAAIAEPLLYRDGLLGVLVIDNDGTGRTFAREDHELLAPFADQAAIAIANAKLFGEVQRDHEWLRQLSLRLVEAQDDERRALARELHDEIGQSLTALHLLLERKANRLGPGTRSELDEAEEMVQALLSRVREMSLNLRPSMLDDQGLLPAMIWNIARFQERTGISVGFKHVGVDRLRFLPAVEGAVYRVVQEAMTNVARHAGVREMEIRLWVASNVLWAQVEDLGIGFDPTTTLTSYASRGLMGMRERVTLVGGKLRIDSAPQSGTSILAEFPMSA